MPGIYRVEISSTSRAGCQNAECKEAAIKIQKGELRFGTFVTIQEHQTWRWKHWGCVTPQQIYNLQESVEDDLEKYLDGYAELDDHDKAKVATAAEKGHVADEDWRGDVEVNRPGQKGFRTPASKQKAKDAKAQQAAENGDKSPSKLADQKKRGRTKREPDADSDDELPAPRKPKAKAQSGKKVKVEDEPAEEPQENQPRKKAGRPRVKKESNEEVKDEADGEDVAVPATEKRGRPSKPASQKIKNEGSDEEGNLPLNSIEHDEDEEMEEPDEAPKPKRGRKPKAKKADDSAATIPEEEHDGDENEDEELDEAPKPKRGRKPKAKKAEDSAAAVPKETTKRKQKKSKDS